MSVPAPLSRRRRSKCKTGDAPGFGDITTLVPMPAIAAPGFLLIMRCHIQYGAL